ncbi:NAD(P)H-quinone oxidoreductase subunit 2, chloroplastic [Rubritalea halochordaticola]|uniref:Probable inorganic carbon transporter subunit DabB n=1 Tax=Rubritalea halochordaticola TaxID=714537 RepID=A0ABP9UZW9_9BACT
MNPTETAYIAATGLVPALLYLICSLTPVLRGEGKKVAQRAAKLILCGGIISWLVAAAVFCFGPVSWSIYEPLGLSVYLDRLSVTILAMVGFLALVITRYSINHLAGDSRQGVFTRHLLQTIAAVQLLCVSGNLLLFTLAWAATSFSLHRLLTFYPDQEGAQLAARKKFFISRLGDLCLVGALITLWQQYGTWDILTLIDLQDSTPVSTWTPILLVLGGLMKSAQLPFHSWLPETMESPTPVSALMHAGVINAGAFLVLRLSPLIVSSDIAMNSMALVGGLTAVIGSLVMVTQPSIKRSLAWSTIAQMGFLILQCGLGAFGLATLHLVAHSLYKAHSFLSTGGVVERARKRKIKHATPAKTTWLVALACSALVVAALILADYGFTAVSASQYILFSILWLGLAQLMTSAWTAPLAKHARIWGIGLSMLVALMVYLLHQGVHTLYDGIYPAIGAPQGIVEWTLLLLIPVLLFGILLIQTQLQSGTQSTGLKRLYIHASNGFYLGTLFARLARPISRPRTNASSN